MFANRMGCFLLCQIRSGTIKKAGIRARSDYWTSLEIIARCQPALFVLFCRSLVTAALFLGIPSHPPSVFLTLPYCSCLLIPNMPIIVPILLLSLVFLPSPPVSLYPSVLFPKPFQTWAHNAPPPPPLQSVSLRLALMTSTARTVTVVHRRDATNWMIVTLSVCMCQRSDIVSYTCRKVSCHWKLNYWVACPSVSGKGGG